MAYEKGYFLLYLVRSDRGAEVLRRLPELRKELASRGVLLSLQRMYHRKYCFFGWLPIFVLDKEHRNRGGRRRYRRQRAVNRSLVRRLASYASQKSVFSEAKQDYANLAEEYDTLGAMRTSLGLALGIYVAYNVYANHGHLTDRLVTKLVTLTIIFSCSVFLFCLLTKARASIFKEIERSLVFNLLLVLSNDDWAQFAASIAHTANNVLPMVTESTEMVAQSQTKPIERNSVKSSRAARQRRRRTATPDP